MKALIHITTFKKGSSQGEVLHVADLNLDIQEVVMPLVCRGGCVSSIIVPDQKVEFVEIVGKKIIIEKGWGIEFEKSGAQFSISVLWEVAEEIRKTFNICPHCHKSI